MDVALTFRNLTDKTITGLRGRVTFLDGFGKLFTNSVSSIMTRSHPNPKKAAARNFDHNQFEDDNPYSKMYPRINVDTAKY
jgi:hypothetical protein